MLANKTSGNIWNPANILTLLRVALIPVFILAYRKGNYIGALIVFLAASLTDWLDGRIARKLRIITNFGKVMDPLADKLLCVAVLVCLASSGKAHWIPVTLVIIKEVLMLIGSSWLLKRGIVVQSQIIGKVAQWLLIIALSLNFFHDFFVNWILPLDAIFLWIAVLMSMSALIFYVFDAYRTLKTMKRERVASL